jgi:hypothetical protein
MSRAFETTQGENVALRRQLKEAEALLSTCKVRKKGKRVALKGRFVFSTQEVLEMVEEAEAETVGKKSRERPGKRKTTQSSKIAEDQLFTEPFSQSESDCIVVMRQ